MRNQSLVTPVATKIQARAIFNFYTAKIEVNRSVEVGKETQKFFAQ